MFLGHKKAPYSNLAKIYCVKEDVDESPFQKSNPHAQESMPHGRSAAIGYITAAKTDRSSPVPWPPEKMKQAKN